MLHEPDELSKSGPLGLSAVMQARQDARRTGIGEQNDNFVWSGSGSLCPVVVIEPAEYWLGLDHVVGRELTSFGRWVSKRWAVVQAAVRPCRMIVAADILLEQPVKMLFVEWDDVIEQILAQSS